MFRSRRIFQNTLRVFEHRDRIHEVDFVFAKIRLALRRIPDELHRALQRILLAASSRGNAHHSWDYSAANAACMKRGIDLAGQSLGLTPRLLELARAVPAGVLYYRNAAGEQFGSN
jgi:hypothetical protein